VRVTRYQGRSFTIAPDCRCHGDGMSANVGRGVSVVTGNAWLDQTDATLPGPSGTLVLTRSYNSHAAVENIPSFVGPGWSHGYGRHIEQHPGGLLRLLEDDGVPTLYTDPDGDRRFTPSAPASETSWIDATDTGFQRSFRQGGSETYDVPRQWRLRHDYGGRGRHLAGRNCDTGRQVRDRTVGLTGITAASVT
jgi:hypothetical protein